MSALRAAEKPASRGAVRRFLARVGVAHCSAMSADFESIHNHHEHAVFEAIARAVPDYPLVSRNDLLPDVACVALNRLPPRYIRHKADMSFYLSERERAEDARAVSDAVRFAFEFVQARRVMKARG